MPLLNLGPNDGLYYEHSHPANTDAPTFVFVNPITGSVDIWQAEVGPALRDAGYGTLAYNFRGQADSPYQDGTVLNDQLISGDLSQLINSLEIDQPVFVGLSIGGLFALQSHLGGIDAAGMVLLNTLRIIGPRIAWINDAVVRAMDVGGPQLMGDIMTPLIWGPDWLAANRSSFLQSDAEYSPIDKNSGAYNLLSNMGAADWNVQYEEISCPVLVVMGLQDRVFYDAEDVSQLMQRIPNVQRVDIPHAGHMLPLEVPNDLIRELLQFAADL